MYVLVTYATRRGPTTRIAERIANGLRENGLQARAEPITNVKSVTVYQAVVLGGNAHMSHWLDAAVRFARHHRKELANRAVWLFSSGPKGTGVPIPPQDTSGIYLPADDPSALQELFPHSAAKDTLPQEFRQLVKLIEPRGERVFAWSQPDVLSQEDEEAIDAWTEEIAAELLAVQ
jgi:menaquinone-dependent protoporphyrinogen oxidase